MDTKRYVLQMQDELSESRQLARVAFLIAIRRLRPHVITDLWTTAFPEFKRAVLSHFRPTIFKGVELKKYQREKEEFSITPQRCGDYVVDLIQLKLSPRYVDTGGPDRVRNAFPSPKRNASEVFACKISGSMATILLSALTPHSADVRSSRHKRYAPPPHLSESYD